MCLLMLAALELCHSENYTKLLETRILKYFTRLVILTIQDKKNIKRIYYI